ncbi:MAG: hypothetical protein CMM46_16250 [Rhodospirillaceae bacterium]|nr:hypothetical protein [Rhodospirillaceae bacterium]
MVDYQADGIVCLRKAFAEEWITLLGQAVEMVMAEPGPYAEEFVKPGSGRFFRDLELAQRHEPSMRFSKEPPAAEITGRIMRSDKINFFYDQLLVKEPGGAERTSWHQDQPYWAVSGR